MGMFPVRHVPLPLPEARFTGDHGGTHYCSVARTPPQPGQSLIRSCQCGNLFLWHDPGWAYMTRWDRWRHRGLLAADLGWLDGEDGPRWGGSPRYRLRRLWLRLRGWDA